MNISTLIAAAAIVAAAGTVGIVGAPAAAADSYPVIQKFGTQEQLVDGAGTIVQGWTVQDVKPSTDRIPWPVHGRLWEATATVRASGDVPSQSSLT